MESGGSGSARRERADLTMSRPSEDLDAFDAEIVLVLTGRCWPEDVIGTSAAMPDVRALAERAWPDHL
jgi:hypothetical protein